MPVDYESLLRKRLESFDKENKQDEELEDPEFYKYKQDIAKSRGLEDASSIISSLNKLGTVGGKYHQSDLPQFAETQTNRIKEDYKDLIGKKNERQKGLLDTIDKLKNAEKQYNQQDKEDKLFGLKERLTNAQIDKLNRTEPQKLDPLLDLKRQKLEKELSGEVKKDVAVERSLKEIMAEEKYRYNSLTSNLNKLEELVKKHGTIDFVGPESGTKKSKLYQMAIDFAKVVDPKSVAREGEVKAAQDYLLSIDWTRPQTALKLLKEFRQDLEDRRMAKHQALDEIYGETYRSISPPKTPVMPKKEIIADPIKSFDDKFNKSNPGDTIEESGRKFEIYLDSDGDKNYREIK